MDILSATTCDSFSEFYNEYRNSIQTYIAYRIPYKYEAEDLTQDVFVRLLDYQQFINRKTIKSFLYTIARNIITDVLRRHYKKEEITSYLYDHIKTSNNDIEENVIANELLALVQTRISKLPTQRRLVYQLRYDRELSILEISNQMRLSNRTVENHLQFARNDIKYYVNEVLKIG